MTRSIDDVDVVVTLNTADPSRIVELSAALRAGGLRVTKSLDALGLVLGSVPSSAVATLQSIPGVAAVEPAGEFTIPPPDSDVA